MKKKLCLHVIGLLLLAFAIPASAGMIVDDFSDNNWTCEAYDGAEWKWNDAPNGWYYVDAPGSERIWFATKGGDGKRAQLYFQRNDTIWDFSAYDSLSFYVMGLKTYAPVGPVDLKLRLMLFDETHNAWVMTPEVAVPYNWAKFTFKKGPVTVGANADFADAWNAGQFHWNDIKLLRFVFSEPSAEYATDIDAHCYVDLIEANDPPVADPLIDDFNDNDGEWAVSVGDGGTFQWMECGGNTWQYVEGTGSMRVWFTTTGADSKRGYCQVQKNGFWDFSSYNALSFSAKADDTQSAGPIDMAMKVVLVDGIHNASLQTQDITMSHPWLKYIFNKGEAVAGPAGDFVDAGNGAAFRWDSITAIKLVFMEPSASYASSLNAHIYVDYMQAENVSAVTPTPIYDDFNTNSSNWIPSTIDGAEFKWAENGGCTWRFVEGGASMRVWYTTKGGDGKRGTCIMECTSKAWNVTPYPVISLNIMGWATGTETPIDGKFKLVLSDVSHNAQVESPEYDLTAGWTYIELAKGTNAVGIAGDFIDAGNGTNFHWDNITSVRLVFMEQSASYAADVDAHVFVDLLQAGEPAPTPYATLTGLKDLDDGTLVQITNDMACTASSTTFADGSFYIEELDRFAGIKVKPASDVVLFVSEGDRVTLTGRMATDGNGERFIEVTSLDNLTSGITPLNSLGFGTKSLSLNNMPKTSGLYASVWGTIKHIGSGFFYIDDGSNVIDGCAGSWTGIRVVTDGLATPITKNISAAKYVVVRGVISLENDGGVTVPVIRPRGDNDITIVQ